MGVQSYLWLVMPVVVMLAGRCHGHGRLIDPPSRASAWRYGFNTPEDYNDNQGFCGGFNYQYQMQGGRCGICGDPWDKTPRPHEVGGKYATGTIVRQYSEGQVIPVKVQITANHMGYFEFRVCPNNNPSVEASQTCLNEYPLFAADGSGFRHYIDSRIGEHLVNLKLPEGLICTQCVFQWRYVAGNNWGTCEDGSGAVGCGPQEEFRACADIAISSSTWTSGGLGGTTTSQSGGGQGWTSTSQSGGGNTITSALPTTARAPPPTTSRTRPATTVTKGTTPGGTGTCWAVGVWENVPGMTNWCELNCHHVPPYCPSTHCRCD